jgi:hypothetical protein
VLGYQRSDLLSSQPPAPASRLRLGKERLQRRLLISLQPPLCPSPRLLGHALYTSCPKAPNPLQHRLLMHFEHYPYVSGCLPLLKMR